MKFEGTPGPWKVNLLKNASIPEIITENNNTVADIGYWLHESPEQNFDHELMRANAQLIASAPDLLEALQDLVLAGENGDLNSLEDLEKAKEAIRKALETNS